MMIHELSLCDAEYAAHAYEEYGNRASVSTGGTTTDYSSDPVDRLEEMRDHATSDPIVRLSYDATGTGRRCWTRSATPPMRTRTTGPTG